MATLKTVGALPALLITPCASPQSGLRSALLREKSPPQDFTDRALLTRTAAQNYPQMQEAVSVIAPQLFTMCLEANERDAAGALLVVIINSPPAYCKLTARKYTAKVRVSASLYARYVITANRFKYRYPQASISPRIATADRDRRCLARVQGRMYSTSDESMIR